MSDSDNSKGRSVPSGRLSRLARLASLGARTASDFAVGKARQAFGDESYSIERQAAKKVLETLGTMKGAAMKLGQQLAMDADALPPEARDIVAKLFAQAPSVSYEEIAGMVTEELGDPPEQVFAEFERQPLASASLGQVHRARLKDGTPVAVKVQYPGVADALLNDLKNAALLMRSLNSASKALYSVDATPYYEEIRREVGAEIDYVREARMSEEYARTVADLPELHVPKVYPAYSSSRVLTLEFVEGVGLKAFAESEATDEERWRVGRQLVHAVLAPFVGHRLVHGDPHPGNFIVRPDGRLTVLDFGAVKKLSPEFVDGFWGLMDAELAGREPEFESLLTSAGFEFRDLERGLQMVKAVHEIAARPVREDTYDWGRCTIVQDTRNHFIEHYRDVSTVLAPPEGLLFYRAVSGMASNLKLLRSAGSYRALAQELCERKRQASA